MLITFTATSLLTTMITIPVTVLTAHSIVNIVRLPFAIIVSFLICPSFKIYILWESYVRNRIGLLGRLYDNHIRWNFMMVL